MSAYILDASVAAKWILPATDEPYTDNALRLLRDYAEGRVSFFVPDLFWPELANILWKSTRVNRITREHAERGLERLHAKPFPTTPSSKVLDEAFLLANTYGHPVYDCIYVALAVLSARPLVTADLRLVNNLAGRYPIRFLAHL